MYLVTFHQCSCQCSQNDRVEQCSFVLAKYKILPMVEGVFTSSTQVKVSLPRYENTPLKALHSKRVKKKRSTLKSHRSDCFHLTYDYIVHTLLWCWGISIFFCRMLQTHNNPPLPPPHTPPPLFILSCCAACWGEVQTRQGGKYLGKGSPKQWERVVGCGLPSAPGGIWGKWPETKLQRWEQRRGQSAPGHSLTVEHNNTPPSTQVLCFQKKVTLLSSYIKVSQGNSNPRYSTYQHVFIVVFLMGWSFFPKHWKYILILRNSLWHSLITRSDTVAELLIMTQEIPQWMALAKISQNWGHTNF